MFNLHSISPQRSSLLFRITLHLTLLCPTFLTAVETRTQPIIGYGFSNAVLPIKNQELFYMGFELGLKHLIKNKNVKDILTIERSTDQSKLGALKLAQSLLKQNVMVLAGFPTSHEAILAAKYSSDKEVLTLFSAASHLDLANFGRTVFTTGESMSSATELMANFIKQNFSTSPGIIISNPQSVYSMNFERTLLAKYKEKKLGMLHPIHLNGNLELNLKDIQYLKAAPSSFLIVTCYPDESAKLIDALNQAGIHLPIIANSSWTTGDIELLRRHLTQRKAQTFSSVVWQPGSKESKEFETLAQKVYGKLPTSEVAYGYDLGVIVAQVYNRIEGPPTRAKFISAFHQNPCFTQTAAGTMCFDPNGGHANRPIYFVRFTKDKGFVPLSEQATPALGR